MVRKIKRKNTYTCSKCPAKFQIIGEYKKHYQKCEEQQPGPSNVKNFQKMAEGSFLVQNDTQPYACAKCSATFSKVRDYRMHYREHEQQPKLSDVKNFQKMAEGSSPIPKGQRTYACAKCSATFSKIRDYRMHCWEHEQQPNLSYGEESTSDQQLQKQNNPAPVAKYECPNCSLRFFKSGTYRRHLLSHLGLQAYFCEDCLVGFVHKSQLFDHRKRNHPRIRRYSCITCGKKFYNCHGLFAHKVEHEDSPPFECPRCPAVFSSAARQTRHLLYHSTKCPICLKPYNTHESLVKHLEKKHPDGDDCEFLSDDTEYESSDDDFDELSHGSESDSCSDDNLNSNTPYVSKQDVQNKRANVCFICERRFRKEISLDNHLNSHRIFRCSNCPMFFPKSSELNLHREEHHLMQEYSYVV